MKKYLILICLMLFPFNVLAYSDYIIPGGQSIGIDINSKGIIIVGFYKVNNKYNNNNLKIGDIILKVENDEVNSINELVSSIEKNVKNNKVNITIKRNNKILNKEFILIKSNEKYKTGLYVKDSITGIGTLTYIDPETKIYGALGHEIIESESNRLVEIKSGNIFQTSVTTIDRSSKGIAGSKNAKFNTNNKYGSINKNTIKGIYGEYTSDISKLKTLKVGTYNDIKKGKAYISTVINNEEVSQFEIEIDNISKGTIKNIHFKITDDQLIDKTGGIVQGMSGSPIIQNNKIIGAVTHVIIDNPLTGYGILITNMLEEGEK